MQFKKLEKGDMIEFIFLLLFVIAILIIVATLVWVIIYFVIRNKKIKHMKADERLKNAKLFNTFEQAVVSTGEPGEIVAISPDGFIGTIDKFKIIIIHIKDIKSFHITFKEEQGEEQIERDSGDILFDNINIVVEPYLKKNIASICLVLNMKDNNVVKIPLLNKNISRKGTTKGIWVLPISKPRQNEIKRVLNAFEEVEKHIKDGS